MTLSSRKSMIAGFFEKEDESEEMEVYKTTTSTENELEEPLEKSELKSSSIGKDSEEVKISDENTEGNGIYLVSFF